MHVDLTIFSCCRKASEGQNTLLLNSANQLVASVPVTAFNSTNDTQNVANYTSPSTSTAYFTADMSTAYGTYVKYNFPIFFVFSFRL